MKEQILRTYKEIDLECIATEVEGDAQNAGWRIVSVSATYKAPFFEAAAVFEEREVLK